MKIMAIVSTHGLPLSVSTHAANHHECACTGTRLLLIEAKPENLIGDLLTTATRSTTRYVRMASR